MSRRDRGQAAEASACDYLEGQGLRLRDANWHCRAGELDLIMTAGETLVFIEVRYRQHSGYGGGIGSIDRRKRQRIIRAARHYLHNHRLHERPARFDVVGLGPDETIEWIPGAFTADDV